MRYGIIGCGGIGQLRAEALAQTPGAQLVAVSDAEPSRAKEVAGRFSSQAVDRWQALVERSDLDAVIVSTPPASHAEISIAALKNGIHVLCEKPLARNVEECQAMVAAAVTAQKTLSTGFNYRFYPSILKAREWLQAGLIGDLDHIRSYAGYTAADHSQAWLHDVNEMGGGALRDNGIHLIDLTAYFLGDVAEVKGFATGHVWEFPGIEDNGFALLRSSKGSLASLQASWTEWKGYQFRIELYGTRGCITASCFPMLTEVIWSEKTSGPKQRKQERFLKTFVMEHLKSYRWVVVQSFIQEFQALEATIAGRPSEIANGQDGLLAIQIAQTAAQNFS